ncbi:hypothetical protein DRE_02211 [Drechslerella stenobrocha 248]|uniref:Choline transport protein n=1 Tax=Drechslerella stenobrocha 248 TaxID=1043628 RepID=W7I8N9_9PEZI|nr:hypothetical protein DRE_02211 [Drechslerella stenobrocha 248]
MTDKEYGNNFKDISQEIGVSGSDTCSSGTGEVVELKKRFTLWSCLAMEFSSMATWACLYVTIGTSIDCGGPVGLIYGTIIVTILNTCMAMSMGEFASIMPKAGAQQLWTLVAGGRYGPVISYYTGYLNLLGEIAMSASCAFNSAQLTGAAVEYTTGVHWARWMTVILYWAYLGVSLIVNFYPRYLSSFNILGFIWLVVTMLATIIVFLVLGERKQSAEFVFATFINNTGWPNGFSYLLGFLPIVYSMTGFDNAAHLAEELEDPEVNAPKAMIGSVAIGGISGLIFSIIMLFCIQDVGAALAADQPYVKMFVDLFKSTLGGCLFITIVGVPINMFAAASITASSSRLAWAMACDGALPGGKYFSRLSKARQVPVRTIILSGLLQASLGIIAFGNDLAFEAILSIAVIALNLSYGMPVYCLWVRGRKILDTMLLQGSQPGIGLHRRWNLGKWGWAINTAAGLWPALLTVLFVFPVYLPEQGLVTAEEANWSIAVLGATMAIATVYWFAFGKKQYVGPVASH